MYSVQHKTIYNIQYTLYFILHTLYLYIYRVVKIHKYKHLDNAIFINKNYKIIFMASYAFMQNQCTINLYICIVSSLPTSYIVQYNRFILNLNAAYVFVYNAATIFRRLHIFFRNLFFRFEFVCYLLYVWYVWYVWYVYVVCQLMRKKHFIFLIYFLRASHPKI